MSDASIQLRALLAEKFPGMATQLHETSAVSPPVWPVQLSSLAANWPNELAKGALTEVVCAGVNTGSAGLMQALLVCGARENQIIVVVDGSDSLDVAQLDPNVLSRLFWVRCRSVPEALKAADLMLRDNNFSLVLLDLKLNPQSHLRKIPATIWYRLQRLIEKTSTVFVIFTPCLLVKATRQRVMLSSFI